MNEYIILTSNPSAYVPSQYRALVQVQMLGTDTVLNITHSANPVLPGDSLVAATDPFTGLPVAPTDEDLYLQIRPLGNDAGQATGPLGYHGWAGTPVRVLGDPQSTYEPARLYPGTDIPFDVTFRHKWFDAAEWSGWGWRVELSPDFEMSGRDPADYFVAIYQAAACTVEDFWYQAGGFVLSPSEFVEGSPMAYATEYNQAELGSPDKTDIHNGICKGSIHIQEGFSTLTVAEDQHDYLFWEFDQGYEPPPVGQWVDTGATIIAQAGTVYRISDAAVAAALIPGQAIRLGDTAETTFTGVWAGGADYIEIDPFVQAAVGDVVWSWQ